MSSSGAHLTWSHFASHSNPADDSTDARVHPVSLLVWTNYTNYRLIMTRTYYSSVEDASVAGFCYIVLHLPQLLMGERQNCLTPEQAFSCRVSKFDDHLVSLLHLAPCDKAQYIHGRTRKTAEKPFARLFECVVQSLWCTR